MVKKFVTCPIRSFLSGELKADRWHLRNYPHTPTDSRHPDKHLRLVMAPNALNCTRKSRAPNLVSTAARQKIDLDL